MLWVALSVVLALGSISFGQSTNATCSASFTWASNSRQQSPCLVAALLESLCVPDGGVQIPALPASTHYTGPAFAQSDICKCNTVTYSMIAACGACQDRAWATWSDWSANCPTVALSVFPIQLPATIDVPAWAFMNISATGGSFSVDAAKTNQSLSAPLTSSATSSTSTSSTSSESSASTVVSTSASSSSTAAAASSDSSHGTNVGAIAGGVVGGLAVVVVLVLIGLWLYVKRRHRQTAANTQAASTPATSPDMSFAKGTSNSYLNASMSSVPTPYVYGSPDRSISPQRSMSPSSAITSGIYTTFGHRASLETLPQDVGHVHVQRQGAYLGAPEV